ncbi:hypothetical protein [uncultured Acetobacteroides sp.]|uniref:hypothetical protein n=1 Tax=uncultured Acetobacteroides sp. TaxID=1760811 RepID=UPI0029F4BA90|nr:hypothetical protein [uncultured Acetobacteroides sp.]
MSKIDKETRIAWETEFLMHLVELSSSKSLELAIEEWKVYGFHHDEDGMPCICGCTTRTIAVMLVNRTNGARLEAGGCCMSRYPHLCGLALLNSFMKAKFSLDSILYVDALRFCLEEELIDKGLFEKYHSIGYEWKRERTVKQIGLIRLVNRIFLNTIRSRVPRGRSIDTIPIFKKTSPKSPGRCFH